MKRFLLLFFLTGFSLSGFTQRVYFLYIQSESEQPFYVKMNEKVYSSASKGYLILSHLRDSSYNFSVGFPGKNSGEQKFAVSMNGKDHGYLLKNNDPQWGLFDLQTMGTIKAATNSQVIEERKSGGKKDESAFTQILAKASDDTTLLEKPELPKIKEEKKTEVAKQEVNQPPVVSEPVKQTELKVEDKKAEIVEEKKAEPIVQKPIEIKKEEPPTVVQVKEEPAVKNEEKPTEPSVYKKSEVIRRSESSTTEGFGVMFIDQLSDSERDTIRILIPPVKIEEPQVKSEVKEEKKFLDISADTIKQAPAVIVNEEKPAEVKTAAVTSTRKNNCPAVASESDFLKLRKKMVGESDDAGMISEATKVFKGKCFTTEQIKILGTLFLRDDGKYKFFDAAYSYVSDIENFSSLQSELKEEYYINRFKAMLR